MNSVVVGKVIQLVAKEAGVKPAKLSLTTTLLRDLGIDGADAAEFFEAFAKEFNVELSGLYLDRHFGSEG